MKLIPLSQGQFAQVDDWTFDWLTQWTWYAVWSKIGKYYYAVRKEPLGKIDGKYKYRTIYMHRFILGLEHGDGLTGDHRDPKQTLNNQVSNLRKANDADQQHNKGAYANNTTGFKGVRKSGNKYRAGFKRMARANILAPVTLVKRHTPCMLQPLSNCMASLPESHKKREVVLKITRQIDAERNEYECPCGTKFIGHITTDTSCGRCRKLKS